MAFFLKEAVLLMVVASVLSFPWRPFETAHAPDGSYGPVQEGLLLLLDDDTATAVDEPPTDDEVEEVYPGTSTKRTKDTGTAVDEPPTDDEVEEVYPGTSTKRTQENSDLNDGETEVDFPIEESRKAFRAKRGVVPKQEYRWPKNQAGNVDIAYAIDGVNDNTERWLNDIFYELKLKTCVRFHKKSAADKHYVTFRKGNGACKSDIGYRGNKDEQLVDLWYPGCDFRGTIMHEVQHLLGFEHEHQRRDRDQYIKIYKDNIKAGLDPQFKLKTQDLVPPYDAYDEHSNMQYNEKAFSKDGTGKTMEARDGQKLGQAAHMDANDVMKINRVYNCPVKQHYVECKLTVKTGDGLGAGTNADVYMKLNGDKGSTNFEMITEGGMIADENERGSAEDHNMAFPDVGTVSSVEVALVEKNAQPPNCSRRRRGQKKRWLISTDGWTVDSATITCKSLNGGISQTFAGPVDLYPGDCKTLNLVK